MFSYILVCRGLISLVASRRLSTQEGELSGLGVTQILVVSGTRGRNVCCKYIYNYMQYK